MADTAPNYRLAPGRDQCDVCFFRQDEGQGCKRFPDLGGDYRPNYLCNDFSPRSMAQRYDEDGKPITHAEVAGEEAGTAHQAGDGGATTEAFRQNILGVQIFRSGEWNGKKYTNKDLDDIIKAAASIGFKPPVKLGHTEEPGAPAYGYVTNLRREGDTLVADFEDVPDDLVDQIKEKRYDQVSSEIYFDLNRGGQKYRRALRAVAVLGAHPPGVANLKPLSEALAILSADAPFETVPFDHEDHSQESDPMTVKTAGGAAPATTSHAAPPAEGVTLADVQQLQQQINELTAKLTAERARADSAGNLQLTIQRLQEQAQSSQAALRQIAEDRRQERINNLVNSVIRPAWRPHIRALADLGTRSDNPDAAPATVSFQASGADQASPTSALDVLSDLVERLNKDVSHGFGELIKNGDMPRKLAGHVDDAGTQLFTLQTEYCRAHPGTSADDARRIVMNDPKNYELVNAWNRAGNH